MTTDYEITPSFQLYFFWKVASRPHPPILYVPFRQNQRYEEIQYTFFRGLELMAGNIASEEELGEQRFSEHILNAHFKTISSKEAGWLMSLPEHLRPGLQSLGLTIPPPGKQ